MILATLLLMQAAYSPETEAVMHRSRQEAKQERAAKARPDGLSLYLPPETAAKLQACIDAATDDPAAGLAFARDWTKDDGGFSAAQCIGYAHARAEQWADAVAAFDGAAQAARQAGSPADAARLSAQAGNAALVGGMAEKARGYFDAALTDGLPDGAAKGEVHLDRARALVALGDMAGARSDLNAALRQVPEDPLAWLLSATLARRQGEMERARTDIAEAKRRAPDDASVALEDGKIAMMAGDEAGAKAAWNHVLTLAPSGEQAAAAREMLGRLDGAEEKPDTASQSHSR